MTRNTKKIWNSTANELLDQLKRGDIQFIDKKTRSGYTWSISINALDRGQPIVVVEPTIKLSKGEVTKIIETAKDSHNIKIEDKEVITWPGKRNGCILEELQISLSRKFSLNIGCR